MLRLQFEYDLPAMLVHDWWTDLSGKGYVGKALRAIRPIREDNGALQVETEWRVLGMTMTLVEKFTLISAEHWIWQPTIFGIAITDDFELSTRNGKTVLTIQSMAEPRGMKGWLAHLLLGPVLDRMMVDEWKSASEALVSETKALR
jgi:hypothetical protein